METIRVFIAVALLPDVKQELTRVADVLATRAPEGSVRWVKPDLIHITLCFLGQTAVSDLNAITQIMDNAVEKQSPLKLHLHGTGCFPNAYRPRVIWVGLSGQMPELAMFKRELDMGLVPLGWEMEKRPFTPHLTLGRVKSAGKLRGVSWDVEMEEVVVGITAVHLIESQLTPQGPIYTTRHTSHFS